MQSFNTAMTDIFERHITAEALPLDAERDAILGARAGDDEALLKLMYAYGYTLRGEVQRYMRALPTLPKPEQVEDVRAEAIAGFIEALNKVDLDKVDRLAAVATKYIRNAVSVAAAEVTGFTVPARTLKRFFGILREAKGDVLAAATLAPEREMKAETFLAVLAAVRNVESYDAFETDDESRSGEGLDTTEAVGLVYSPTPIEDAEDRILVEAAFGAVEDLEEDVCRLAYGFEDYDPLSDDATGERLGLSRQKTQRTRTAALGKMRNALGVA